MQKNCGKSFLKTTEDFKNKKRFCKSFLSRNRKILKRERFLCAACSFLLILSAPAVCYKKATTPIFASEYEKDGGPAAGALPDAAAGVRRVGGGAGGLPAERL